MSTQGKNTHLHGRIWPPMEDVACPEGSKFDRKARLERLFERGVQIASQHPDMPGPDNVPDVIRLARRERTLRNS